MYEDNIGMNLSLQKKGLLFWSSSRPRTMSDMYYFMVSNLMIRNRLRCIVRIFDIVGKVAMRNIGSSASKKWIISFFSKYSNILVMSFTLDLPVKIRLSRRQGENYFLLG